MRATVIAWMCKDLGISALRSHTNASMLTYAPTFNPVLTVMSGRTSKMISRHGELDSSKQALVTCMERASNGKPMRQTGCTTFSPLLMVLSLDIILWVKDLLMLFMKWPTM